MTMWHSLRYFAWQLRWTPIVVLLSAVPVLAEGGSATGARIDFTRDIRPILSDACFLCHGPDEGTREADIRLDTKEGAFADLGNGKKAIVPGQPMQSMAYRLMVSKDPDARMPPADSGKKLTKEQIEKFKLWIEQGANYSQHWAFEPPQRSAVPVPKDATWGKNPIDAFVLSRLDKEKMEPSPTADRVTLLRRLSLDLIGLPPTIAEIDAFKRDPRADAYRLQVDRLLASPHYGERWGRLWLDAARYADSDGYEKDKSRQVWFYRDWVINALNRDLPYDQFIIEQIAGDLLPNSTQEQKVATGFLRNSMINEEGGADPEQFRMEAMFDRMDAIGKGVLGLTIACAQCHSHKYDPLTHEEYYRLFAFLNNSHEANMAAYTPPENMKRAEIFRAIRSLEDELKEQYPDWKERMAAWETIIKNDPISWTVLKGEWEDNSLGGQKMFLQSDDSYLAQGYAPTKNRPKMTVRVDAPKITAFRLELLNDPNLPRSGPGRSIRGTAALTEFEVEVVPAGGDGKKQKVKFVRASADLAAPEKPLDAIYHDKSDKKRVTGPIEYAIDGKAETAWSTDVDPGRRNLPRKAVFVAETPIENPKGMELAVYLSQQHGGWNSDDNQSHNIGRFRISITDAPDAVADPLPPHVRRAIQIPADRRSSEQVSAIFSHFRTTVDQWQATNDRIEEHWKQYPDGSTQLVLMERPAPRSTFLLDRGEFLKPKQQVEPGVPAFLNPLTVDAPKDRLTLARWLVDRKAPTTSRSLVNRVWQTYFGTGLCSTSEDLGSQAETPSHPELLDWLAVEFMDKGWSLKQLHRLIVTSATYRQSSTVSKAGASKDPYNRLLGRGARFRVDGEIVRDIALAASGLLDAKVGGPSVCPPAPDFLFQPPVSYGPKVWNEATDSNRYRRALYTFRYRSVPYPMLQTFDAPNGDASCVRRSRSNTPLQALTTLNEPLFMECAQSLALKTLAEGGANDAERLDYAFRRCLSRSPSSDDSAVLLGLLKKQSERYAAAAKDEKAPLDPWQLASANPQKKPDLPAGATPASLAAWTAISRVLLNLDETITRE